MIRLFRALIFLLFTVLALDLLYLYYSGAWTDPVAGIRIAELVCLYAFVPIGLGLMLHELYHYEKEATK